MAVFGYTTPTAAMALRPLLALTAVATLGVLGHTSGTRTPSVGELLDRYASGEFEAVVTALEDLETYEPVLLHLREHGRTWIQQKGQDAVARRELAAATFALEAARAGQWHEWKIIRKQPLMCAAPAPPVPDEEPAEDQQDGGQQQQRQPDRVPADMPCYTPPDVLRWQSPPLLLEWGCQLLRAHATPVPVERWWQLAALAVAQRSEDPQFLIGDINIGRGPEFGEIGNTQDEIKHLDHIVERFSTESRFQLAQGIARDRDLPQDAMMAYRALERDPDVGGEAMMRLGAMHVRRRSNVAQLIPPQTSSANAAAALNALEKAESLTRDPYVIYLARYFAGQAHLGQGRIDRAEAAFRGALAAVPKAESASLGLASLLFRDGRRTEAQLLVRTMLDAEPPVRDPWRSYVHADDRFWPRLIARLRAEITR